MNTWIPPQYAEQPATKIDLRTVTDWSQGLINLIGNSHVIYYVGQNYSPFFMHSRYPYVHTFRVTENFINDTPIQLIVPTFRTRVRVAIPTTTNYNYVLVTLKLRVINVEYSIPNEELHIYYTADFLYVDSETSLGVNLTSEIGGAYGLVFAGTPTFDIISTNLETHYVMTRDYFTKSTPNERTSNECLSSLTTQESTSRINRGKSTILSRLWKLKRKKEGQ